MGGKDPMFIPELPEMQGELPHKYGEEKNKRRTAEVDACQERLLKWCQGSGLDLGCGPKKIRPEAIGIDDSCAWVAQITGDISDLSMFRSNSFDYVFSSHALEDIEATRSTLKEWLRVIKNYRNPEKPGGYLVLYCPDPQYYYNIGHPKANTRHKHDYYWWDVARIISAIHPDGELIHYARYGPVYEVGEWSWELVVQKH